MSEVEDTLKRLQAHKGVIGHIVINSDGIPIRTTMDPTITVQYSALCHNLVGKARNSVRDIDSTDELTFIRMRTKRHEIMIAPDKEYVLLAIQQPQSAMNMGGAK